MAISKLSLRLFLVSFLSIFCNSAFSVSSSVSSDTICNLTPYPSFCESNSPNGHGDIHEYGRFFVEKSLSSSKMFFSLLSQYLKSSSKFSNSTILALQDCHLLLDLNKRFLSKTLKTINSTDTLGGSEDENFHTLLSATLTNQDTCLNSLQETTSNPDKDLLTHLSNGTKLYSISLAIFKRGWKAKNNTEKKLGRNMWEQRLYELIRRRGRKLLQLGVDNNVVVNQSVVVNPDGSGNYTTINDAVAAAPNNSQGSNGFFVIHVVGGVYEEYVSIPREKQYLMMIGDGINQTIITGNHSVVDGWTTFNSATFAVIAKGFVAINITFRNTAGAIKHQAVALRSGADLSAFYNCSFEGYQDTLYTHSLRQFYRNCDIYGTVDFIFGNAAVVLQNCNMYPRLPMQNQFNAITAQGRTDVNQNTGTSIHNCTITAASDLAGSNGTTKTYLGRPWKQYSQTVYMQSFMDSLIDPLGWVAWSGDFALDTLYYAEFDNLGPGSDTSNRVTWPGYHVINATEAVNFTVSNFILGGIWLPATGVPYYPDLLTP
ncbi:pectinesterase-like [Vigna unguiculata]|uniref:pectinesterase-like n=1 Tax=Vigna unguiculata TaxID=3917 RepID=UPI001016A9F0|nr:pectinesterase-like [Vigna unguiculata]